jgi:acetolactate synthase-1/2/3 large subunit
MGFGVPGAVAAGLREPTRTSVVLVGDGGYLMTGNELATAQRYGVPIKIFLADNGAYGSIRLNQEVAYPSRVIGTGLTSPDFVKIGEAFGALAIGVTRVEDVDPAVARALAHPGAALVVVKSSLETTSAYTTLAQARQRTKR